MGRVGMLQKFLLMLLLISIATAVAAVTQDKFNIYFADLLSLLVYLLVPWSAINLADYYIVCKGRYSIEDMFTLDGIYGRYRWGSIAVYLVSILVQIPFMSLSFYTGPLARTFGADIAWLPGLIVPTALYCALATKQTAKASATG
jgi:NCS1 family nucleobase:cation symporter-1